jgi:hypothetical protein
MFRRLLRLFVYGAILLQAVAAAISIFDHVTGHSEGGRAKMSPTAIETRLSSSDIAERYEAGVCCAAP